MNQVLSTYQHRLQKSNKKEKACFLFLKIPFCQFANKIPQKGSPLQKKEVPSKPSKETQNPESKPTDIQQSAPMVTESPFFSPFNWADHWCRSLKETYSRNYMNLTIRRQRPLSSLVGYARSGKKNIQELDSPNQQMKKLKRDSGRPYYDWWDQAKTIKRKRELAAQKLGMC